MKLKNAKGFTLIELMIVVAVIGILAAIAVPNFIAYRNKARIGGGLETGQSVRNALGAYACTSVNNTFPMMAEIPDWKKLRDICNINGALLKETIIEQGFTAMFYHPANSAGTINSCDNTNPRNECSDYCLIFRVSSVPHDLYGAQIEIRPEGITRQTY